MKFKAMVLAGAICASPAIAALDTEFAPAVRIWSGTATFIVNATTHAKPCTIRYGCRVIRPGPAILLTPTERCEGDPDACECKTGITIPNQADNDLSDANPCKDGDLE